MEPKILKEIPEGYCPACQAHYGHLVIEDGEGRDIFEVTECAKCGYEIECKYVRDKYLQEEE